MAQISLEDYLNGQYKKLKELSMATTFIQNKENPLVANGLRAAQSELSSINNSLNLTRDDLKKMRNQNESMKTLLDHLARLTEDIRHMESNVPPKLLHDYANVQLTESKNNGNKTLSMKEDTPNWHSAGSQLSDDVFEEDKENSVKNCKKILFNDPHESFPVIRLLDEEEFRIIPKYMIGRQSIDAVNQFLATINEILKAKYSLLALGKNGARKKGEFDLYMSYKKQESADGKEKGKVYFFTAEDYNRHTKTKLDKTKLNLLTVLRHCKRLREVRASKAIQYTLILS